MKRRLTYLAAAVLLVDLFALSAVWHVSPTISLTVGLAVPAAEELLAPLYPDPVRVDLTSGEMHRPARPRSALVLTAEARRPEIDRRAVARALARRDIAVLVPASSAAVDTTVAYASTLGVPVRIESIASFPDVPALSTVGTRAAYGWRLLRLSHRLLTVR